MIVEQRHDTVVRKLWAAAGFIRAIVALARGAAVDFDQSPADGAHPHLSRAVIREGFYLRRAKRITEVMTQQPTAWIPVTGAALARPDPEHAAAVLIER